MIGRARLAQEGHVANKDKGGSKSDKKQSQKSLKEKRAAKKQKKGKQPPLTP